MDEPLTPTERAELVFYYQRAAELLRERGLHLGGSAVSTGDVAIAAAESLFRQVRGGEVTPADAKLEEVMFAIARRHFNRIQRAESRHRTVSNDVLKDAGHEHAARAGFTEEQFLGALQEVLDQLTSRQQAILLHRLEGCTFEQIAASLRTSVYVVRLEWDAILEIILKLKDVPE